VAGIHFIVAAGTTLTATPFTTGAISTGEARAPGFITVQARFPDLSMETARRLEGTLNLAVRVVFARALSAATTMADRLEVIRHGEAPASAALVAAGVADFTAAVAGADNRSLGFRVDCEI
jgi:hypothetical protein